MSASGGVRALRRLGDRLSHLHVALDLLDSLPAAGLSAWGGHQCPAAGRNGGYSVRIGTPIPLRRVRPKRRSSRCRTVLSPTSPCSCLFVFLHCALASGAVYCNRSCLSVCLCVFVADGRASGRAVSKPYYSQRARSVCVSLGAFFIVFVLVLYFEFFYGLTALML